MLAFPYEAVTLYGTIQVASSTVNTTLLNITPPEQYTVFDARIYSDLSSSNVTMSIHCSSPTNPIVKQTSRNSSASMPFEKQSEVWGKYVCTDDLAVRSSGPSFTSDVSYSVTYLPYHANYPVLSYLDVLLFQMIVLFLLSFSVFGFFFSPWRKK